MQFKDDAIIRLMSKPLILSEPAKESYDSTQVNDRATKVTTHQKLLATLEVVDQAAGELLLPTEMLANSEANGQFASTVSRYLQRNVL
jgi:hypothetical protein